MSVHDYILVACTEYPEVNTQWHI